MWEIRRKASLLLDSGHVYARKYPLGMLWQETELVVQRRNQDAVTQATLLRAAAAAVMSKDGSREFQKLIKRLSDG